MSRLSITLAVLSLAGISNAWATNGYFAHGYGGKNEGMGGAGIAFSQDSIAPATNPAGIAKVPDRWDVGMDYFMPRRGASIHGNFFGPDESYDGSGEHFFTERDFLIPNFGYVHAINDKWTWGIAAFGNGGMNTTYKNNPFARFGSTGTAGVDLAQLFLAPTIAYKITETQTVGVSLDFVYQRFKATGLGVFSSTILPGPYSESVHSVTDNGYNSSRGVGGRFGWQGDFGALSFGATWQPKIRMTKFDEYKGLFAGQGSFDIPETYGVGVAWHATEALTFAADYQRINYSGVPSVSNPLSNLQNPNSLDAQLIALLPANGAGSLNAVLQSLQAGQNLISVIGALGNSPLAGLLTNLSGPVSDMRFGNKLGSDNGPGFGWQDIDVYKIGVNYQLNPLITLRAGYSDNQQPIPEDQTFFNILAPGVVRKHYTAGATLSMYPHEITLNVMHAPEVTVKGQNSIPNAALPLPPESFGGGEADIRLKEDVIGLSYGYRF